MKLTVLFAGCLVTLRLVAAEFSTAELMAQGEGLANKGESLAALEIYKQAEKLSLTNAVLLCRIAKCYCDAMHTSKDAAVKKDFAQKALVAAQASLKADPKSPMTHCCVAVCYAKQFPFSDNQTKVDYSRQIKIEAEKAIELDPKFDLAYHMLARWNYEVANMNFLVKGLIRIAYGGLPKASMETAIENFKKAIELSPDRIIHHLQLARMYHVTGQEKLAPAELKKCTALSPVDMDDKDAQEIAKKVLKGEKWPEEF